MNDSTCYYFSLKVLAIFKIGHFREGNYGNPNHFWFPFLNLLF